MATVRVKINGKDHTIACDDGQEDHLRFLSDEVDDRLRSLIFRMGGNPGDMMALLLTALTMADELSENKREMENLSSEIRYLMSIVDEDKQVAQENRVAAMETAMAVTLEEIAQRIEKIADQIEIR
jgi:cell division protein ZapA